MKRAFATLIILVMLASSAQATVSPSTGIWTQRASLPYITVRAAVLSGAIYIVTWPNTLYVYDSNSDTWRNQSTVPQPEGVQISSFRLFACDDKLYVIGKGASNGQSVYINEAYDPITDSWVSKTPPAPPGTYVGISIYDAAATKDKIYFIGGAGALGGEIPALQSNEVYDAANDTWSQGAPLPIPVFGYASAVWEDKIFIIGGCTSGFSGGMSPPQYNCTSAVQIYDPSTNQWSQGTPLLQAMMSMGAAAASGCIFVVGGWAGEYNDKGGNNSGHWPGLGIATFDLNQIYDPQTGAWSTGAPLPIAVRDVCLLSVYDGLYALGGQDETLAYLAANYHYAPGFPTSMQVTTNDGTVLSFYVDGNITGSQVQNAYLSSNQSAGSTLLSFNVAGVIGDVGFQNVTIPKSALAGVVLAPVVRADGALITAQGFCEDVDNYYVWYSVHFGTYTVSIEFPTPDHGWNLPLWVYATMATAVVCACLLLYFTRRKKRSGEA
jgi:hypothetical protein